MVKSDKNGFLTSVKTSDKLELTEIRKDLPQYVRNRKSVPKITNNMNFLAKSKELNSDLKISSNKPENQKNKLYTHDCARIIYQPEEGKKSQIQILGEKALLRMFTIRK